ncbi:MAG: hypothetical protein HY548_02965 [Elusimicrobia bacterium]|nr:hypothetical protein [Elusimicrobiota bacterium]
MISLAYVEILKDYPEHLDWPLLEKIYNRSRRTLKRWRAEGKLNRVAFIYSPAGDLQAVKATVIEDLQRSLEETQKDLTPPQMQQA